MSDALNLLLAEQACRALVVAAADAVDGQDYAALANLFTPDAVLVRPNGIPLEGRAAIEEAYAARDPDRLTQHLICNHVVRVAADGQSAESRCMVLLWAGRHSDARTARGRPADSVQQLGPVVDQMVRTAEGWRIRRRDASFTLFG